MKKSLNSECNNISIDGHDQLQTHSLALKLVNKVVKDDVVICIKSLQDTEIEELPLDSFISKYGYSYSNLDLLVMGFDSYKLLKNENSFKSSKVLLVAKNGFNELSNEKCRLKESDGHLDKFSLTLDVERNVRKKFTKIVTSKGLLKRVSKNNVRCRYYRKRLINKEQSFKVQYSPFNRKNNCFKFTWNPSVTSDSFVNSIFYELKKAVGSNYSEVVGESLISRVDFAVDKRGWEIAELIINVSGSSRFTSYFDCFGNVETKIVGGSDFRFQAYNKSLEQSIITNDPMTRFEVQFKRPTLDEERVQLKNLCTTVDKINKLKIYDFCKNSYIRTSEMNTLKEFGVIGLRSTLGNDTDKRRLARNLAKIEIQDFWDELVANALKELKELKKLLMKPSA
ncbi:hypothetical protein L1264_03480 [Pseudoalteromonas sp. APAL1]|uniref:hypothetical protein n=1 Tax=Pseudoalteromonas sp. APAL1 TaxID=2908883 RepID=UPI001F347AFA|nr:hypothetical protein [Pseudoalteromonas sp. APAL1]MCF2919538.1 hypothetical protein [Pseudoalteromonas sp. APAL1]